MAVDAKRTNRPSTIGGIVVYDVWGVMGPPRMAMAAASGCLNFASAESTIKLWLGYRFTISNFPLCKSSRIGVSGV